MFGQVIAAHEAPLADAADKLLLPRVRPAVSRQLVGSGKLLIAAFPVTAERLLACVCAQVSLQVRALKVGFLAAGEVADVVSASGEVCLRDAAARSGRQVDGRRRQGEELSVAQRHDGVRRCGRLWHNEHLHGRLHEGGDQP